MGKFWRRSFAFEVPVRCPEIWSAPAVRAALTETLSFLSDDAYCFDFRQAEKPLPAERFFDFGSDDTLTPNSVLLFSGGLDSTAGALSELLDRGRRVALVSRQSSPKMARVQKDLVRLIGERAGFERVLRVPLSLQIAKGSNREGTHRSRSFLFAAIAASVAASVERDRIKFFENGIVSLNLPPVGQIVGARATRTTHPQTLAGFTRILSAALGREIQVGNPFIWRTKSDILAEFRRLDALDMIAHTRSWTPVLTSRLDFLPASEGLFIPVCSRSDSEMFTATMGCVRSLGG